MKCAKLEKNKYGPYDITSHCNITTVMVCVSNITELLLNKYILNYS